MGTQSIYLSIVPIQVKTQSTSHFTTFTKLFGFGSRCFIPRRYTELDSHRAIPIPTEYHISLTSTRYSLSGFFLYFSDSLTYRPPTPPTHTQLGEECLTHLTTIETSRTSGTRDQTLVLLPLSSPRPKQKKKSRSGLEIKV